MTFTSDLDSTPNDVIISSDRVIIRLNNGSEVYAPFDQFKRLREATQAQRNNWQWIGARSGIHWPDIDEDLSVHGIIRDDQIRRDALRRVPFLVADLMRLTQELNRLFPGRKFTPDGHLIGSLGEVVAQHIYNLRLEPCSTPGIDAYTQDGARSVQIKLTGMPKGSYRFRWSNSGSQAIPDILLALQLSDFGFTEIYNGPFPTELLLERKDQKNGQVGIASATLAARNPKLLPQMNMLADFNTFFRYELEAAA